MRASTVALALLSIVALACDGASGRTLWVDLRTDLVLGDDFTRVETLVADEPLGVTVEARRVEATPTIGSDFVRGARVAELAGIADGTHYARVSLLALDGRVVISRDVVVDVDADLAITVVLSSRCEGLVCPGASDPPSFTSCSSGRCVDPRCTPETPAYCGAMECITDNECPDPPGCLAPLCGEGVCLVGPDDLGCGDGARCVSDGTCVARPSDGGGPDGGPPMLDGSRPGVDGGPPPPRDGGFDAGPMISTTFCPMVALRREQMAFFLVRYLHGTSFVPPAATGVFTDVMTGSPYAPYIEQLARDGITTGCGGTMFCPTIDVLRAQGAVFFVRTLHGASFTPPAASGTVFTDVMTSTLFAAHIEQLARDGITTGCGAGLYCPDLPLTRAQTAIFIVRMQHGRSYVPPAGTGLFDDVPRGSLEEPYIEQFVRDGYSVGCGI